MSEQDHQTPAPQKRRRASRAKVEESKQPAQPATTEPPIGDRWGEFPSPERQAELEQRLEAWQQKRNHKGQLGTFAEFELTGADVFWLAVLVGGKVVAGSKDAVELYEEVDLSNLNLQGAILIGAQLQNAILIGAQLQGAILAVAQLQGATLFNAQMQGAILAFAHLEGANLSGAKLEGADLRGAQMQGANLSEAQMQGATLLLARLEGADLRKARLNGVDLREATLDVKTHLAEARLDAIRIADVVWNDVLLNRIDWELVLRLGDENAARQPKTDVGQLKGKDNWLADYQAAARAYRQLAIILRGQGIAEAADNFTYRALIMQRKALWRRLKSRKINKLGSYLFSLFLAVLAGYGFRMWRIIVTYLALILAFATAYWSVGVQHPRDISFWEALIVSVTAFHGRVFTNPFMPNIPDAQVVITAFEAVVGLIIEGVFISMLVQRFFNR